MIGIHFPWNPTGFRNARGTGWLRKAEKEVPIMSQSSPEADTRLVGTTIHVARSLLSAWSAVSPASQPGTRPWDQAVSVCYALAACFSQQDL